MNNIKQPSYFEWGNNRVYVLMALTRARENDGMTANSRKVRRMIVREQDEWDQCVAELVHWCQRDDLTYRLYVSANARDVKKATFKLRGEMDSWLNMQLNGQDTVYKKFKMIDSEFKSVLQSPDCRAERYNLYDIDGWSETGLAKFLSENDNLNVVYETDTPNGYHLVVDPCMMSEREGMEILSDGMIHLAQL